MDDAKIAGAQSGQYSVETYTYAPVAGKPVPTVLVSGQMPTTRDEIVLAPISAQQLHAKTGSVIKLAGGGAPITERVSGIGFVPTGPHNDYSDGGWLTPAGVQPPVRGRPLRLQVPRGHGGRCAPAPTSPPWPSG